MDIRRPLQVVAPTLDGDVLAVLSRADAELTAPQLHRLIGHSSVEGVRKAAERLAGQGIVLRRRVGPAYLYVLNREHLAAVHIEGLATLRDQLIARLRQHIAAWELAPVVVALFGSTARGGSTPTSDLDLLVIRPSGHDPDHPIWRAQLDELQRSATAWTGNDARVLEFGADELTADRELVIDEARRDGIELAGSLRTLRAPSRRAR